MGEKALAKIKRKNKKRKSKLSKQLSGKDLKVSPYFPKLTIPIEA